jgi:hypothetical protein
MGFVLCSDGGSVRLALGASAGSTIEYARTKVTTYIHDHHHKPHSGLGYRTPAEVAEAWRILLPPQTDAT